MIAPELIAAHGDGVADYLQAKIDALTEARDPEQLSAWLVIRNAVALSLKATAPFIDGAGGTYTAGQCGRALATFG